MSQAAIDVLLLQHQVEQFYYHEAELLDERQYQQWLALISEDMQYLMPGRSSPQRDSSKRGKEDFLAVEDELEGSAVNGAPLREENALIMAFRADRAYKLNAWGSNPPARTRRLISNIRIQPQDNALRVRSNFLMYYSRHRDDNHLYSGERIDQLRITGGENGFLIAHREVRLDWNTITGPTVGLFF